jgi:hypothetical protein
MQWNYSEKLHRRETIEELAARYLERLRDLITHCLSDNAGGFTPSDFELTSMTSQSLREVAAQLNEELEADEPRPINEKPGTKSRSMAS